MAQKHLRAVAKAAATIRNAHETLGDKMLAAQESGETIVDIGKAAGLGRSRVFELLREARRRRDEREQQ